MQKPPPVIKFYRTFGTRPLMEASPLEVPDMLNHRSQILVSQDMDRVIDQLVRMEVLELAILRLSFVLQMFLTPKSEGSLRPIFNLKSLNNYVFVEKFRFINVYTIVTFLHPRDWLVKIDVSKTYFHLHVSKSHRGFLRIIYKHQLWQKTCLPFGLACAPKIFVTLPNWIAQVLRQKGFKYLDDYLLAC